MLIIDCYSQIFSLVFSLGNHRLDRSYWSDWTYWLVMNFILNIYLFNVVFYRSTRLTRRSWPARRTRHSRASGNILIHCMCWILIYNESFLSIQGTYWSTGTTRWSWSERWTWRSKYNVVCIYILLYSFVYRQDLSECKQLFSYKIDRWLYFKEEIKVSSVQR